MCVLAVEPATGRLKLGLASSKKASSAVSEAASEGDPYAGLEAGDLAEAVIKQVRGGGRRGVQAGGRLLLSIALAALYMLLLLSV